VKTANELRSEAGRMREFHLGVTDPEVLEEIEIMNRRLEADQAIAAGQGLAPGALELMPRRQGRERRGGGLCTCS
jgi:hypothetical protein